VEWVREAAVDSDADFAAAFAGSVADLAGEWVRAAAVADFTAADVDSVAAVADLVMVSVRDLPVTTMLTGRET